MKAGEERRQGRRRQPARRSDEGKTGGRKDGRTIGRTALRRSSGAWQTRRSSKRSEAASGGKLSAASLGGGRRWEEEERGRGGGEEKRRGGEEEKRGIGRRRVNVQPVEIKIPPRKTSLEKVGAPAHFSFSFSLFPLSFFSDPSAIFHHRSFFSS